MLWTDKKINDVCEPGSRLVNYEFHYVNRLIVEDIRNDYELALTYANNNLAAAAAEIKRLTAENAALRVEVAEGKKVGGER